MSWQLRISILVALSGAASALAQDAPAAPADPPAALAPAKPAPAKPAPAKPAPEVKPAPAKPAPEVKPAPAAAKPAPVAEAAPTAEAAAAATPAVAPESGTDAELDAAPAPSSAPSSEAPPPVLPAEPAPQAVPSPGEMEDRLGAELPETVRIADDWTAPTPVLTLHGYMRMRGELMDTFWLGRPALADFLEDANVDRADKFGQGPDPFTAFRPIEQRRLPGSGSAPGDLDCVDEETNRDGTCDVSTLRFATMRLRLAPQLNLSEDVRVKMAFDVLDNVSAGEAPASYYGSGPAATLFADTDRPLEDQTGGLADSIKARRAWAEVRSRDLGELRFGRMPQEWGLGMVYNAGNGIDDDLSTDLDRVLFISKVFGLYVTASYDFIAEGLWTLNGPTGGPLDQSQLDDVDQLTFSVARRYTPEEAESRKELGQLSLQGGLQLTIRNQDSVPFARDDEDLSPITEIEGSFNTWDAWGQLRYRWLRVELEAAYRTGSMDRVQYELLNDGSLDLTRAGGSVDLEAFGYALETEIRLVDEKLGLYFDHGLASGDNEVDGLSSDTDFVTQLGDDPKDKDVSTFRFHPSYRVDMILWRNLMRQVTGAYYFKPGISYDFVRGEFGQLFGARLDFIWSRASAPLQTWGNDADLGIELNVSLYFQTEDGPDLDDGFHSLLQYGVLFPMRGLGYVHEDTDLDTAQNLRLLLGVKF